jgi:hypothetical protein
VEVGHHAQLVLLQRLARARVLDERLDKGVALA